MLIHLGRKRPTYVTDSLSTNLNIDIQFIGNMRKVFPQARPGVFTDTRGWFFHGHARVVFFTDTPGGFHGHAWVVIMYMFMWLRITVCG